MLENLMMNEGKILEFKENTQSLSKIIQTIVAFANTAGGTIIIGIKDKTKKIVGVQLCMKKKKFLMQLLILSIPYFYLILKFIILVIKNY